MAFGGTVMNKETMQLIAELRQGNRKKAEDLYNPELQRIYSYLTLFTNEKERVNACLKKTVQQSYLHLSEVTEEDDFSLWLLSFARVEALKILDSLSVYEKPQEEETSEEHDIPETAKECLNALVKELSRLTPYERAVTVLYLYDELTMTDIAGLMGREQSVIEALLKNSRNKTDHHYLGRLIAALKPAAKPPVESTSTSNIPETVQEETEKKEEEKPRSDLTFTNRVLAIDDSFLTKTNPVVKVVERKEKEVRKGFYDYEEEKQPRSNQLILILILVLIAILLFFLVILLFFRK